MNFPTPDGQFNVLSLFDGMSCLQIALKELGITPSVYYASEIKKTGIDFSLHNFPGTKHLGDVTKWRSWSLPRIDLIAFGSPCFPKGSLINTSKGIVDLSEVSVGDLVLTHNGNWREVTATNERLFVGNMYSIKVGKDTNPVRCTPEHPFYVVYADAYGKDRKWSEPFWCEAKDLTKNHFLVVAEQKEDIAVDLTEDEAYLFGYYLAEGWIDRRKTKSGRQMFGITFAMSLSEREHFTNLLSRISYRGRYKEKKSIAVSWDYKTEGDCCKAHITNERLWTLFHTAGHGAKNKVVPSCILSAPVNIQKSFLDGYMYGDGSYTSKDRRYTATSLNPEMIYGLRHLVLRVTKELGSVYFSVPKAKTVINGRTVNQRPYYDLMWNLEKEKEVLSYRVNDLMLVKITDIFQECVSEPVYNLTVDKDNTYTIGGYSVHNCQDFSNLNRSAVKSKGLAGKESGLFFEAFDILNDVRRTNPAVLFMAENVTGSDILSEYLRVKPVKVNNLEFACSSRTRLFFTNIGAEKKFDILGGVYYEQHIPDSLGNANITLKLDSPSLDVKGLWIGEDAALKFLSHPLATGTILRDGFPAQTGCMIRGRNLNKFGFSWVYQHGRYRHHTEGELRQMHSVPDWVEFPNKTLGVVQDLIGDSWALGSVGYILKRLPFLQADQNK